MRTAIIAATIILVTVVALFVWPTPYRPITLSAGAPPAVLSAREQRVTGRVELLTRDGWVALEPKADLMTELERKYGIR